ncbi:hypothetical protein GCM10027275_30720 [Rhabdobacter roseus]|uniref:Uncharacterized protein n=1 Tax=Rhabdobacter roseus TaxID=1655419 RepID=A0A840TYR5_9BACT|nr:hypothetical protein [Rhabdobacter roseus]MBB5285030.1 hypothetical protein [Rhabdobacter roseus]
MAHAYKLTYFTKTATINPKSIGKITVAREEGEAFFREKMSGSMTLSGDDYLFMLEAQAYAQNCCQELTLSVEQVCREEVDVFWEGTFTLQDLEWDYDQQSVTITSVKVKDLYGAIIGNWHREVNWLDYKVLTPFKFPVPTTEEFNPAGSDMHSRARHFNSALLYLIKQTLLGTGYEDMAEVTLAELSEFLCADTNPVTGKENYLRDVSLLQISDAKRPSASNPAIKGIVTLKDVLDNLKKMYNAYWTITEEGKFKIEHISYFPHGSYTPPVVTLDLTAPAYKETMRGTNRLSYANDRLKGIEGVEFSISKSAFEAKSEVYTEPKNPSSAEFSAAYMTYSESCVPRDSKGERTEEVISVGLFTTDWQTIVYRPDTMPDEGWVLVHTIINPAWSEVPYGWLPISGLRYPNGHLAASRLYYDFGRYANSFAYGLFGNQKEQPPKPITTPPAAAIELPLKSRSVKPIKKFATVQLSRCCGEVYDFTGLVKHPLAEVAEIDQLEFDLLTQTVELTIVAANECSDIPFPEYYEPIEPEQGCYPAGTLLRTEEVRRYSQNNAAYYVTVIELADVYADGKCAEYKTTRTKSLTTPRRGNGPR